MVRTWCSHCRGPVWVLGQGTNIPQASQHSQNQKIIERGGYFLHSPSASWHGYKAVLPHGQRTVFPVCHLNISIHFWQVLCLVLPGRLFPRGQVSLWTSVLCHSEVPRDVRGHKWAKHSSTGHPRADQGLRAPTDRGVSPLGRGPAVYTQACRAFLSGASAPALSQRPSHLWPKAGRLSPPLGP